MRHFGLYIKTICNYIKHHSPYALLLPGNSCADVLKNGGENDGVYEILTHKEKFKVRALSSINHDAIVLKKMSKRIFKIYNCRLCFRNSSYQVFLYFFIFFIIDTSRKNSMYCLPCVTIL